VTVNQAFRIVLPTREELIAGLKLADEADLLAKVRERLEEANREMEDRRIEGELVQRLIDLHPMELPESVVVDQVDSRLENLRKELEGQGLPASDVEAQVASQADGARVAAERARPRLLPDRRNCAKGRPARDR
jgi:FKBP-type peptidyl-prolyl cis-trans isomerase (trigger factor)